MKYLVDANLLFKTKLWQDSKFIHQVLINDKEKDEEIWEKAKKMNMVILTKDNDFLEKILNSNPPPKVILFRTGNMKFVEFDLFLKNKWKEIENKIKFNKLVIVYKEKIETIK